MMPNERDNIAGPRVNKIDGREEDRYNSQWNEAGLVNNAMMKVSFRAREPVRYFWSDPSALKMHSQCR